MRYILKNPEPTIFETWKITNLETLQEKFATEKGGKIWDWFGKNHPIERDNLRESLLLEQGYICCYCGRSIDNGFPNTMEHFRSKGCEHHKRKMFDYQNLMISCKCSALTEPSLIQFKVTQGYENLETQNQISEKAGCSTKKLREWNPLLVLDQDPRKSIQLEKGDDLYLYIKHCDDKKDGIDIEEVSNQILDPLTDATLADKFKYKMDGTIKLVGLSETVKNNVLYNVLNLNAHNLCELRSQEVLAAEKDKKRLLQDFEKGIITEGELIDEINSQELPNEKNRRRAFCFIYSYVLKQLIS
jgi:uncharacterized protein (TIGR02646 family)